MQEGLYDRQCGGLLLANELLTCESEGSAAAAAENPAAAPGKGGERKGSNFDSGKWSIKEQQMVSRYSKVSSKRRRKKPKSRSSKIRSFGQI